MRFRPSPRRKYIGLLPISPRCFAGEPYTYTFEDEGFVPSLPVPALPRMEEVAVSPMVAAAVVLKDNNGADDAVSSTAIPSITTVSVEEKEEKEINGDVSTITSAASNGEERFATPVSSRSPSTRKKRGAFGLFRAMFLSFGRSDNIKKTGGGVTRSPKKRAIVAAAADDHRPAGDESPSWKSLVDGVRPLRLRGQELEYYPPPPPLGHAADVYHDVILPPPSPARSGFEFEVVGMTSRYASAEDLHQMDAADEEDALAAEEGGDADDGDSSCPHAIDMQAEEFIAKFYEQFKSESFNGRASE